MKEQKPAAHLESAMCDFKKFINAANTNINNTILKEFLYNKYFEYQFDALVSMCEQRWLLWYCVRNDAQNQKRFWYDQKKTALVLYEGNPPPYPLLLPTTILTANKKKHIKTYSTHVKESNESLRLHIHISLPQYHRVLFSSFFFFLGKSV